MTDLRYAVRSLSRSKGFVVVAVLSLALAIGLNTTVFAVLDSFVHPYVPYRNPDGLVRFAINGNWYAGREGGTRNDHYLFIREKARFAQDMAIWDLKAGLAKSRWGGQQVSVADVSRNFLSLLGVVPALGRPFTERDGEDVVLVSYSLWQHLLGRQPLSSPPTFTIDGRTHAVIGVMPAEMTVPSAADVWRPLPAGAIETGVPMGQPQVVARLKDGVTQAQAKAEIILLAATLENRFAPSRIRFNPVFDSLAPDAFSLSASHWALAASGLLVFLIACANLANLMLARGVARRGELALRLAIGASRAHLVRQLTTEAGILAVAGGVLGVVAAVWGIGIAIGNLPQGQTFLTLHPLHLSWRVFAFASLASMLTVVLFGLLPAIRASDVNVADPLKDGAGTTTRIRGRYSLLAVTQVALALTLLLAAAIMVKSATLLAYRDLGYEPEGLYLGWLGYPNQPPLGAAELDHVLARVQTVPGVERAALVRFSGKTPLLSEENVSINLLQSVWVTPDYLRAIGIGVKEGRDFEPGDRDVVILSEAAAKRLSPARSVVGQSVAVFEAPSFCYPACSPSQGVQNPRIIWKRVVGVSRDRDRTNNLNPVRDAYIVPAAGSSRFASVVLRTDGSNPTVAVDAAREMQLAAGWANPPRLGLQEEDFFLDAASKRFIAGLFTLLGLCGLGLAAVGLYGVLAHTVGLRTREFGIRRALGATAQQILGLVMHDGAVMFLAGTAVGAFVAMGATQFVGSLLYDVSTTDVLSLIVSEGILCGVAFLACLIPARRAMRANPLEILRAI